MSGEVRGRALTQFARNFQNRTVRTGGHGDADGSCELPRECRNVRGTNVEAMIRHRSGAGGHWFDDIEAIDLGCRALGQIAAGREIARIANVSRTGSEEIGIQRNDHVRADRSDKPG